MLTISIPNCLTKQINNSVLQQFYYLIKFNPIINIVIIIMNRALKPESFETLPSIPTYVNKRIQDSLKFSLCTSRNEFE